MKTLPILKELSVCGLMAICFIVGYGSGEYDKEGKTTLLLEEIDRLKADLEAARAQLDAATKTEAASLLPGPEKEAEEKLKELKTEFDQSKVEYDDDSHTMSINPIIVGVKNGQMEGKNFVEGTGTLFFREKRGAAGTFTLYRQIEPEVIWIWQNKTDHPLTEEDIPENHRPNGHLPAGQYLITFMEKGDTEVFIRGFTVVKPEAELKKP